MAFWSTELLPFLIPLACVLLFIGLQVFLLLFTGISLGLEADADVDLDMDVDVDADIDLDVHHGFDLDLDLDHDHDVDVDGNHSHGFSLARLLSPLGVGQVPLTVVGQAFGLSFGITGLALTYGLHAALGASQLWFLGVTIPASLISAWFMTKRLVRMVVPLLRVSGQAESKANLVGKSGVVTSLRVDEEYGEISISVNGAQNYMFVRSLGQTIERGNEVVVVDYDVDAQRPIVAPVPSTPTVSTS